MYFLFVCFFPTLVCTSLASQYSINKVINRLTSHNAHVCCVDVTIEFYWSVQSKIVTHAPLAELSESKSLT